MRTPDLATLQILAVEVLNFAPDEYLRSAHLTTVLAFTVRPTVDVPETATTGADATDACPGPMELDALTVNA